MAWPLQFHSSLKIINCQIQNSSPNLTYSQLYPQVLIWGNHQGFREFVGLGGRRKKLKMLDNFDVMTPELGSYRIHSIKEG